MFEYNVSVHGSLHTSPFTVVYGASPRIVSLAPPSQDKGGLLPVLEPCIPGFTVIRKLVTEMLLDAKLKQQNYYNASRSIMNFKVGDKVLYRNPKIRPAGSKLMPAYEGPYIVLEIVNPVTYVLGAQDSTATFTSHISKLKPWRTHSMPTRNQILSEQLRTTELEEQSEESEEEELALTPVRLRRVTDEGSPRWRLDLSSEEASGTSDSSTGWLSEDFNSLSSGSEITEVELPQVPGQIPVSPTITLASLRTRKK